MIDKRESIPLWGLLGSAVFKLMLPLVWYKIGTTYITALDGTQKMEYIFEFECIKLTHHKEGYCNIQGNFDI